MPPAWPLRASNSPVVETNDEKREWFDVVSERRDRPGREVLDEAHLDPWIRVRPHEAPDGRDARSGERREREGESEWLRAGVSSRIGGSTPSMRSTVEPLTRALATTGLLPRYCYGFTLSKNDRGAQERMARTTTTVTFSLPPDMAAQVDQLVEREGRSRSELVREALRRYIDDAEWRRLLDYGEQRARVLGIGPEDVERLVDEYRAESDASST